LYASRARPARWYHRRPPGATPCLGPGRVRSGPARSHSSANPSSARSPALSQLPPGKQRTSRPPWRLFWTERPRSRHNQIISCLRFAAKKRGPGVATAKRSAAPWRSLTGLAAWPSLEKGLGAAGQGMRLGACAASFARWECEAWTVVQYSQSLSTG
jgi:hypothetical protein